jgi:cob(I)alamin adenosyltransferase
VRIIWLPPRPFAAQVTNLEGSDTHFMKIYTKTGDDGTTGLLGSRRIPKDDPRIEAYGTVDELNASIGVARANGLPAEFDKLLARVQEELFLVGSGLADPDPSGPFQGLIGRDRIERLEHEIDELEASLEPLANFILPAGTAAAAGVHFSRTICRRAEREIVELSRHTNEHVCNNMIIYLNRLGDWLFVLARAINRSSETADVVWKGVSR